MESVQKFQDLIVWQKAHHFVLEVYKLTANFPEEEKFGLISQLRRAAISVPANIAEGFRRLGNADKIRFLNIAQSSLSECNYYLILGKDLGFYQEHQAVTLEEDTARLLQKCIRTLKEKGQ